MHYLHIQGRETFQENWINMEYNNLLLFKLIPARDLTDIYVHFH